MKNHNQLNNFSSFNNVINFSFYQRVVDFLPKMAILAYLVLFFIAFKGMGNISLSMMLLYAITVFIDFRTEL